jgi:hypothetical protein
MLMVGGIHLLIKHFVFPVISLLHILVRLLPPPLLQLVGSWQLVPNNSRVDETQWMRRRD